MIDRCDTQVSCVGCPTMSLRPVKTQTVQHTQDKPNQIWGNKTENAASDDFVIS